MSNENSQKISDFFPWSENSFGIALNDFILCLDKLSTSGEFVFLQLLLSRIRTGATIRLIACNHSEQHYISILRKNNIDVQRLQNSGKLEIVRVSNQVGQGSNWDELVQWQKLLTSSSDQYTVFVDDLEALELLSPTPMTARRFISHFIHELGGDSPRLLNLVAFGRQSYEHEAPFDGLDFGAAQIDSYGGMNNEPSLCNYALYRADTTMTVSVLSTGYSSAVHGSVTVTRRENAILRQVLHYKALDSGVTCTLVGRNTF